MQFSEMPLSSLRVCGIITTHILFKYLIVLKVTFEYECVFISNSGSYKYEVGQYCFDKRHDKDFIQSLVVLLLTILHIPNKLPVISSLINSYNVHTMSIHSCNSVLMVIWNS